MCQAIRRAPPKNVITTSLERSPSSATAQATRDEPNTLFEVKHEPSDEHSPEIMQRHRNHSSLAHSNECTCSETEKHYVWIWIMLVKRFRSEKTDVVHIRGSLIAKTCFQVTAAIEARRSLWKHLGPPFDMARTDFNCLMHYRYSTIA